MRARLTAAEAGEFDEALEARETRSELLRGAIRPELDARARAAEREARAADPFAELRELIDSIGRR